MLARVFCRHTSPSLVPHLTRDRSVGSHVIFALQQTRRYKVISIDNHHNSSPKALERVAQIARDSLPSTASEKDKDSAEIDAHTVDLTKRDEIRKVFEKYGKGGIWGVVHIAVCVLFLTVAAKALTCSLGIQSRRRVHRNPLDLLREQRLGDRLSPPNHVRI